jgi:hypothetical protein
MHNKDKCENMTTITPLSDTHWNEEKRLLFHLLDISFLNSFIPLTSSG